MSDKADDDALLKGVGFILAIAAGVAVAALWAVVLQHLWRWFIVTAFGLPPLTFWSAMGLHLVAYCLTRGCHNGDAARRVERELGIDDGALARIWLGLGQSAVSALFGWGVGWVYASLGGLT
jgi:hypothetical protein